MAHNHDTHEQKSKGKLTPYCVLLLCYLGLGSMSFGYTSSVIGTLLGKSSDLVELVVR